MPAYQPPRDLDLNIFGFICHIKKAQTRAGVVPLKVRIVLYAGLAAGCHPSWP